MALPAWKIAADIGEGYVTLNPVFLKKYEAHELTALSAELEKASREIRSTFVPVDDGEATQKRNRRLMRLSQALTVLTSYKNRR